MRKTPLRFASTGISIRNLFTHFAFFLFFLSLSRIFKLMAENDEEKSYLALYTDVRKRKGENGPEYIGAKKKKTRKLFLFTHSFLGKRPARSCMYASRTLHKHASAMWKPRTTTKTGKRRQKKKRKTGRTIERSPGERGEERQKDRGTEPRNDGSGQRGNRGREKGGRRGEEERGSQPGVTYKARGTRKGRDQPSRRGETEKKCVKQKNEKVKKEKAFSGGRERGRGCILHLAVSEPYSGAALLMRGPPADCTDRSGLEKK